MATMTQTEKHGAGDAASSASPIELEEVTHHYGSRLALDQLSFRVREAEIFGLLGPNGSGKTTLFRILSTLMISTGGAARIQGFDAAREPNKVRQQTGIVFQARSVDIKLTVAENLKHQGHLYGLHGAHLKQRIGEVLERVGLLDRANDRVETLSGGQQRRVELAKGLIHSPSVLLLDEPSTGLDPGARRDLWQYLRTLRDQEGVTILVTTHLMEEAEHCDRLAILSEGKLVALGSPGELKAQIGGDIVTFETAGPEQAAQLAAEITARFGAPAAVLGNAVRVERDQGHRFLTEVVEAFPGRIESVSVAKPSLEDVFIDRTGHRFWNEDPQADEFTRGKKKKRGH
jgi:ABC-2 type transport system ATP-binding protein